MNNKNADIRTLKLPYSLDNKSNRKFIIKIMNQQNHIFRSAFNKFNNNQTCKFNDFDFYNNIELLDSWLKQSAIYDAKSLITYDNEHNVIHQKVIFGGKYNFNRRQIVKGRTRISKEEFFLNRLRPLYCIGEKSSGTKSVHGNRKFKLTEDLSSVIFKMKIPETDNSNKKSLKEIILKLPKNLHKNNFDIISKIYYHQIKDDIPISYRLDDKYIYIIYDNKLLNSNLNNYNQNYNQNRNFVKDRILALDKNPNYIGWTVVDWKSITKYKIVYSGVFSIKEINEYDFNLKHKHYSSNSKERIYISNKRQNETINIAKEMIELAKFYHVQFVADEDLNITSKDNKKRTKYNKLVNNNWCRNIFDWQLDKRCKQACIKHIQVNPAYSSYIGNFLYRSENLPDMCLAALEISRRCFEIYHKLMIKDIYCPKDSDGKFIKGFIIQPSLDQFAQQFSKSMEEFRFEFEPKNFKQIYNYLKDSKMMYRVSLDSINPKFVKLKNKKSMVSYCFFS